MNPVWLCVALSLAGSELTEAAPPTSTAAMPWANVAPEDEAKATELRDQGNRELYGGLLQDAAEHYRQALERWDHPAIRYNYAQALNKLFKLLECREQLEAATRYGPEPLGDEEKYKTGLAMLANVEGELTRLEITCDEPGAFVTLDDQANVVGCPGTFARWMLPGPHVLVIEKPGLVRRKKPVELRKGKRMSVLFQIFSEDQMKKSRSRWAWWVPWAVIGAGAAAGGAGVAVHVQAFGTLTSYDNSIARCAASPADPGFSGCPADQGQQLALVRDRGYAQQRVAWGLYLAGGAALLTGAALLGLNLPETYLDDPELDLRAVAVAPVLGPGVGGVQLAVSF